MEPALTRVLNIPELVDLVASHLSKNDMSSLMKTSRHMQQSVTPAFYRDLSTYHSKLETGGSNLWESPEGLRALARNIRHVRIWRSGGFFFVYYFHATAAHNDNDNSNDNGSEPPSSSSQEETRQQQHDILFIPQLTGTWDAQPSDNLHAQPANTPSSSTPHLFSSATRDAFRLVPLPAMTQLARMELSLYWTQREHHSSYILPNHYNPQATIIRLCGVLRLLPQLRDLHVYGLLVMDFWSAQLVTSTLLDMVNLERLVIDLGPKGSYRGIAKVLFFGCPPSIQQLCIDRVRTSWQGDIDNSDIGNWIENGVVEALPRRTTQLVNLRDLTLNEWEDCATKEELLCIFEQCSGLEALRMLYPTVPAGFDAADIGRICPRLHNISLMGEALPPYAIMETLPENRLETLDYYSLARPLLDDATARRTILRHASSLQSIKIQSPAQSSALRMILATCEGLEYVSFCSTCIDLSDAVACSPWASTQMRYLSIHVNVVPQSSSSPSQVSSPPSAYYIPYYLKTPPAPPTADDKQIFSQLEAFYRQIGELKNLVYLHIGRAFFNERGLIAGSFMSEEMPLPGMLHLRGSDVDRPGFLDLLGGLSKLEKIGGSIIPETKDFKFSKDAKEVEWVLEHWPLLSKTHTTFFPS